MQPYLRDAVGGDLSAIAAILRVAAIERDERGVVVDRGRGHDLAGPPAASAYREALAEIDRTEGNYVLVAEVDGLITAFCQLVTYRHLHARGGRTGELVALHVADPFRTSGIADLLLEHAAGRAREIGCRRLRVEADHATIRDDGLWERHGFVSIGRALERVLMSERDHSGRIRRSDGEALPAGRD
jgi:GNAT superfamily N-acetyltransferase